MVQSKSIIEYRLTDHAKDQMARRQISESDVKRVLLAPEQTEPVCEGREIYQSRVELGEPPKTYLLRVFVDVDRKPPEIVTFLPNQQDRKILES